MMVGSGDGGIECCSLREGVAVEEPHCLMCHEMVDADTVVAVHC